MTEIEKQKYDRNSILGSMATAIWSSELGLAEVVKMKGNFWKTTGFSINQRSFLYPEEALLLYDKKSILLLVESNRVSISTFYELVLEKIPLSCYLVYVKLKNLEYIVYRHKKRLVTLTNEEEAIQMISTSSSKPLLDVLVSYRIFVHAKDWAKSKIEITTPSAYVIVTTSRVSFSPQLTMRILDAADGVPVIFAVVYGTGFVQLEEYTDAEQSLDWTNAFAMPPLGTSTAVSTVSPTSMELPPIDISTQLLAGTDEETFSDALPGRSNEEESQHEHATLV